MGYFRAVAEYPIADRARSSALTVEPQTSAQQWNEFVDSHADAASYHRWEWRHVFERAFGREAVYLGAREKGGPLVGILPLVVFRRSLFGTFVVSLPFVNYGGVLARDQVVADALREAAAALAAQVGASHIELRHRTRIFPQLSAKSHKVGMRLLLPASADAFWERLDRKVRNQVRKAEKSGLTTVTGGAELLREFYKVFASNMRDLGTPVYSRRLFEEVLRQFPDRTRVVIVRLGDLAVAGGISLRDRATMEVPWAASLKEYRSLCPNNLLYWTMIQQAIAADAGILDFGRSTPDEGPYLFKRQWGAVPEPLCWEYQLVSRNQMPDHSPSSKKFRTAVALWKRLPLPVATLIGPSIVRSIP